jgi:hypothetical protein
MWRFNGRSVPELGHGLDPSAPAFAGYGGHDRAATAADHGAVTCGSHRPELAGRLGGCERHAASKAYHGADILDVSRAKLHRPGALQGGVPPSGYSHSMVPGGLEVTS